MMEISSLLDEMFCPVTEKHSVRGNGSSLAWGKNSFNQGKRPGFELEVLFRQEKGVQSLHRRSIHSRRRETWILLQINT